MNIFVGFGYNDEDKWIKKLIFPLVESFDGSILTGEDLQGQVITQGVTDKIKKSDGVLAFLTRRDPLPDGKFSTHPWVRDEQSTALALNKPCVEIREQLVHNPQGIAAGRQYVQFDLDRKEDLLVEVAKILSSWRRNLRPKRLVLLPKEIVQEARPHISNGGLTCSYQYMDGSRESAVYQTKPFRFGQGLCIDVNNVPSESALIQISLKGPHFSWTSDYESIQLLTINLQKD